MMYQSMTEKLKHSNGDNKAKGQRLLAFNIELIFSFYKFKTVLNDFLLLAVDQPITLCRTLQSRVYIIKIKKIYLNNVFRNQSTL